MTHPSEKLRMWFTGELRRKIVKFKQKASWSYSDDFYCTLRGIDLAHPYKGKTNNLGDPTGNRATKLADLTLTRKKAYLHYLGLHQSITDIIQGLDEKEVYLLKVYLGVIEGTFAEAIETVGISRWHARKKIKEVIKEVGKINAY